MMKKADIRKLVLDAIGELNRQLPPDRPLLASLDTILMGEGGILDSLGLVNLLVMIEEGVERRFDAVISLIDASVDEQNDSAFKSVDSLCAWLESQI
jgi:acyl carrier protein